MREEESATFQAVSLEYVKELEEAGSIGYSKMIERNNRYFSEFVKGNILLADITPELIVCQGQHPSCGYYSRTD